MTDLLAIGSVVEVRNGEASRAVVCPYSTTINYHIQLIFATLKRSRDTEGGSYRQW